ncbi:MAG: hypothetical protein AAGH83_02380 [Pseudomonadota bacterium]
MKAIAVGLVMIVVISGAAWYGLSLTGFSAEEVQSSPAVRLD